MIISKDTGRKLIADGHAKPESLVKNDDGTYMVAISNIGYKRTDHYPVGAGDEEMRDEYWENKGE